MFATRAATRVAFRSPVLRRGIHSGERGNWARSSAIILGVVVATTGTAVGSYLSYRPFEATQSTLGEKYDKVRQKAPEPKSKPASTTKSIPPKSQSTSSVDSPTPAKPSLSEPGVLEPTSKPDSDKPADKSSAESNPDKAGDMEGLESDAASQGAFNPETGEINWDCPCLGGMAHGPCGPQFREAFSCFIYSEQEPKGVDCVEKFKDMQDCFREHPDVYGEEVDDDDDDESRLDTPDAEKGTESAEYHRPASDEISETPVEKKSETPAEKTKAPAEKKADVPVEKDFDAPAEKAPKPTAEKESNTPVEEKAAVPSTPSKDPEPRTRVPTVNVSPDKTPSKSSAKH